MAVTENFFTGDGSTTSYVFTFEYIDEDDVKVSLDGSVTTAYSFANATTILFNTAPASNVEIRIYRDTGIDDLKSTFFAGSAIRAQDLNKNFEQNNFAVQEIKNYTWNNETDTIHSDETWVSTDTQIATTAAMDARFQDEVNDTLTKAELAALSDVIPDNDDAVPTTGAVKDYVDHVIETDILVDGTGLTKTGSGGQVTLGISANSVDFDRIKDSDIITDAEQDAGSPAPANTNIFTALGAARRFDTIVSQAEQSSSINWEVGKTWLQNDSEKTVRIWDGAAWVAIASGGAFTTLPKVVYVDAVNGNDSLQGHRISNPKRTIKAAIEQINAETDEIGDGSVVIVAPGVYQEIAPIDIQKKNVSIIGQALRSCIVHPTPATEENTLFRLNSGSYVANLTLTGVKASGIRGGNSLDTDATYGLPTNQGWNFAFYPGATIVKSPYIANCTNFSDSEIDNSDLNAFNPRGGLGGDTDSAPTGGGILIDGSVVDSSSPLRSMVCDSYTHVGLDGPGIFVTNNGYCQATSSYAFFTHYHIKTLNGGQANLAASTSDFGRYGLIASGKSSTNIFTASSVGTTAQNSTTITIGAPSADSSWYGSATRPQSNMLLQVGGNPDGTGGTIYSIIGSTANGSGWDVEISNPDPTNLSNNLGFSSAVPDSTTIRFFLRSMIASSGHTMEYVGSGTNYSALPENGGVPIEANEIVNLNNGKVWAATTNHQGKFTVGDTFNVDQVTGYVNIANGAIGLEQLIENLDLNGFTLSDSTGDVTIADTLDMNSNNIINVSGLTMDGNITMNAQSDVRFADSDSSNYVAIQGPATVGTNYTLTLPNSVGNAGEALITDANGNLSWSSSVGTVVDQIIEGDTKVEAVDTGSNGELQFTTDGTRAMTIDNSQQVDISQAGTAASPALIFNSDTNTGIYSPGADQVAISTNGTGRLLIDASGNVTVDSTTFYVDAVNNRVGIGTNAPSTNGVLDIVHTSGTGLCVTRGTKNIAFSGNYAGADEKCIIQSSSGMALAFHTNGDNERLRITSDGKLGLGTSSPNSRLHLDSGSAALMSELNSTNANGGYISFTSSSVVYGDIGTAAQLVSAGSASDFAVNARGSRGLALGTNNTSRLYINSSGNVGIGSTAPQSILHLAGTNPQLILDPGAGNTGPVSINSWRTNTPIVFKPGDTERVRIDGSGRLLVGTSTSRQVTIGESAGWDPRVQVTKTGTDGGNIAAYSWSTYNTSTGGGQGIGPDIVLARSNSDTEGTHVALTSAQLLGRITFNGSNGSAFAAGAYIAATADDVWASGDHPTRLVFSTTASGASSPTERMRINSSGAFGLSGANYGTAGQVLTSNGSSASPTWENSGTPAGTVIYYAASTAPTGYLKANGAAISRTTYADLFAAVGTTYGSGDGSTTFNLPDLRGEFLRGWDDGRGVDSGRGFGTFQADELKSHNHSISPSHVCGRAGAFSATAGSQPLSDAYLSIGYTGGPETRPRNIALLACIKY